MDIPNILPEAAAQLGIQPSGLLFWLVVISAVCNLVAKRIPDTSTGWLAKVRAVCAFVGLHLSSVVKPGVTIADVARAAAETPPIPQKVAAQQSVDQAVKS